LLEGKNVEAEKLVYAHFTCRGPGSGRARGKDLPYGSYQALGDLKFQFFTHASNSDSPVTNYRRELNLSEAMARTSYTQGGVRYWREIFASAPDEAIVIRLTSDKVGALAFTTSFDRPERCDVKASDTGLTITGQLNNGTDGKGVKYAAHVRVI